jgi:hypothetical protein
MSQPEQKHIELWVTFCQAWQAQNTAYQELSRHTVLLKQYGDIDETPLVNLLKWAFQNETRFGRFVIYEIVKSLSPESQCLLIDELFEHAIRFEDKRLYNKAQQILLELPREWLQEQVRKKTEEFMQAEPEYMPVKLFGLAMKVDQALARQLAEIALTRDDQYHQENGRHTLKLLDEGEGQ